MRVESASAAKDDKTSRIYRTLPSDGSRVREIYDRFQAQRGLPIEFSARQIGGNYSIEMLRNFYGLNIRYLGRGRWVLAGEWFGREYHDYIAERIHAADRKAAQ